MIPSSPPYARMHLRRPHNYSSGKETRGVSPLPCKWFSRVRLGTQLQQKVPANLLLLEYCEPQWHWDAQGHPKVIPAGVLQGKPMHQKGAVLLCPADTKASCRPWGLWSRAVVRVCTWGLSANLRLRMGTWQLCSWPWPLALIFGFC